MPTVRSLSVFKERKAAILSGQLKPWGRLSYWRMSGKRSTLKKEGIKKWREE
jgi:hypothetical protein